jgi:RND family efflux transporter MFP subunit
MIARFWRRLLAGIVILAPVLTHGESTLPFDTTMAEMAQAPRERVFDGTVEAVNRATMSAQTSGRIAEVYFDVDDYVEAGQAIVRFTNLEQQAALASAEAALSEAVARQKQSDEDFRRVEGLFNSGSSSKREYDQATAARDAAIARVAAARSAIATAEQQLEYTLVRAPYAGIVTERFVEVGESIAVGQPLMSGLSLESLRVVVDIPQHVAARVREFQTAFILTDAARIPAAKLTIFPFADSTSNTFTVRIELPPGQFDLYPGMFVKASFVVGDEERLLVARSALIRRSEVSGVYVVNEDDEVRFRQVRVGGVFGDRVEVLAGLAQGERVAVDPVRAGIHLISTVAARDED